VLVEGNTLCPAAGGRQARCLFKAQDLEERSGSRGTKLQHERRHGPSAASPALRASGRPLPGALCASLPSSGLQVLRTTPNVSVCGAEAASVIADAAWPPARGLQPVGTGTGLLHVLHAEVWEEGTSGCSQRLLKSPVIAGQSSPTKL